MRRDARYRIMVDGIGFAGYHPLIGDSEKFFSRYLWEKADLFLKVYLSENPNPEICIRIEPF